MSIKDVFQKLADRPAEEAVEIGDGQAVTVRRVSPREAMSAAGLAGGEDPTAWMAKLASLSVIDGDGRPLANDEGFELVKSLPPGDFVALTAAAMRVNGFDQPGKSTRASGSSTDSALPSESTAPTESQSG